MIHLTESVALDVHHILALDWNYPHNKGGKKPLAYRISLTGDKLQVITVSHERMLVIYPNWEAVLTRYWYERLRRPNPETPNNLRLHLETTPDLSWPVVTAMKRLLPKGEQHAISYHIEHYVARDYRAGIGLAFVKVLNRSV
jgi:hypothetical protein